MFLDTRIWLLAPRVARLQRLLRCDGRRGNINATQSIAGTAALLENSAAALCEGRVAALRREHLCTFEAHLAEIRATAAFDGSVRSSPTAAGRRVDSSVAAGCIEPCMTTSVLLDNVRYASNAGSVLRHLAILHGGGLSALILSSSSPSSPSSTACAGHSGAFLKNVLRISLAATQTTRPRTQLVVLPPGDPSWALQTMRSEGYHLTALENCEACSPKEDDTLVTALWDAPLACVRRLLFVAGGEDRSLAPEILRLCDHQCYVPGVSHPPTLVGANTRAARRELGEHWHNPTLNLAHAVVIALYERRRQVAAAPSVAPS